MKIESNYYSMMPITGYTTSVYDSIGWLPYIYLLSFPLYATQETFCAFKSWSRFHSVLIRFFFYFDRNEKYYNIIKEEEMRKLNERQLTLTMGHKILLSRKLPLKDLVNENWKRMRDKYVKKRFISELRMVYGVSDGFG